MTEELVKRVDEFVDKNLPWWEKEEDESLNTCRGVSAKSILETLDDYLNEDFNLKHDIYLEACRETIATDKTWFDDADKGYCPAMVIANYDDIYLTTGRWVIEHTLHKKDIESSAYYLADCWSDPMQFIKVSR